MCISSVLVHGLALPKGIWVIIPDECASTTLGEVNYRKEKKEKSYSLSLTSTIQLYSAS